MQVIRTIFAVMIAVLTFQASAQVQQARGQYSINYKDSVGVFDRKEAPSAIKQKAKQEAALRAVETYFAEAGQSESANFDAIRGKFWKIRSATSSTPRCCPKPMIRRTSNTPWQFASPSMWPICAMHRKLAPQ